MSEHRPDALGDDSPAGRAAEAHPPATGHPGIDSALAAVDLSGDVHGHHDHLARALETVRRTLDEPRQPRP